MQQKLSWKLIAVLSIVLTLSALAAVPAAIITVGTPGPSTTQDCIAFGCGLVAQFIFDASYFSGPVTITGLEFYNSLVESPDTFDPATYTVSLSTTTSSVAAPSSTFATNRGGDFTTFAGPTFVPGGAIPGVISFSGAPFSYDPSAGNLLVEFNKPDSADTFSGFTDYNSGGGFLVSRVWNSNGSPSGSVDVNYGPVASFITGAAAVPEPGTMTLLGLGVLGMVGAGAYRRRKA